jgi:hypothetical protein
VENDTLKSMTTKLRLLVYSLALLLMAVNGYGQLVITNLAVSS